MPRARSRFNAASCRYLNVSESTHHRKSSNCSSGFNLAAAALIFSTALIVEKYHNAPSALYLFLRLRRDLQAQRVEPDETRGVVLVVGFGRIGFHGGDVRVVKAHRT